MKEIIASWKDQGKKILVVYVPVALVSVSKRFFESFVALTGPDIAEEMDKKYNVKMVAMLHDKFPIDLNRNSAVDRADREFKADYIQFLDADQVFPKDTIPRLFQHITDETPVATGLYWRKGGSMRCVAGKYAPNSRHETKMGSLKEQGFIAPDGSQCLYYKPLTSYDVVEPIDVSGMGCLLARMDVFKALDHPYFKYTNGYLAEGDFTLDHSSEEMWFFSQLKKKGIKMMCDPSVRCGHLKEVVVGCPESE